MEKQRNNRLRLSCTEYALDTYEGGTPLLSLAFPLTRDRYQNGATRAFLDGLLPEGDPRRAIAEDLDLPASVQKADRVTAERIVNEARRWGMTRSSAEEIVADSLDRLPAAISQAAEEIDTLPHSLPELVNRRVDQLRTSTPPSRP